MKVWDVRNFKNVVHTFDDLPNFYTMCVMSCLIRFAFKTIAQYSLRTDCSFSPDEALIVTGTSSKVEGVCIFFFFCRTACEVEITMLQAAGLLAMFDAKTFEKKMHLSFPNNGVIRSTWNPRLNQIFVSTVTGQFDPLTASLSCLFRFKVMSACTSTSKRASGQRHHRVNIILTHLIRQRCADVCW